MVEVTPDGSVPCRKDPCCADSRGAPAPAHAECGKQKLRAGLEALIESAARRCEHQLVGGAGVRADILRVLVVDVLKEEAESRRYLHNNLLGRVQSELFEVSQALQPRPGLIDYGSLRAKIEAARTSANELGKQFTPEHGLLDEGSETGAYRMPASLIVDELERAMGGILVTSSPGPQLKKLLADLRGALMGELQALDVLRQERRELKGSHDRLEKDLENTRLAHTRLAEDKREVEAELSRTKQALAERDKALAEADKVRSNHAIERESYLYDNRRLHRDSSRVCQELTRLQDDLRKQLARAEAHNAGLRREVENHLAAQSYIASALGVEPNGSWQPIKDHLTTPGRSNIPQDLAAEMISTLERAGFGLQPGQPNTLWAMVRDCSTAVVQLRAREEAHRTTLREREWEQRQISDALVSARADAAERKGQIDALRQKISLLEHENHLLAERLGRAYQMEMDARRTLAETNLLLQNMTRKAENTPIAQSLRESDG